MLHMLLNCKSLNLWSPRCNSTVLSRARHRSAFDLLTNVMALKGFIGCAIHLWVCWTLRYTRHNMFVQLRSPFSPSSAPWDALYRPSQGIVFSTPLLQQWPMLIFDGQWQCRSSPSRLCRLYYSLHTGDPLMESREMTHTGCD